MFSVALSNLRTVQVGNNFLEAVVTDLLDNLLNTVWYKSVGLEGSVGG